MSRASGIRGGFTDAGGPLRAKNFRGSLIVMGGRGRRGSRSTGGAAVAWAFCLVFWSCSGGQLVRDGGGTSGAGSTGGRMSGRDGSAMDVAGTRGGRFRRHRSGMDGGGPGGGPRPGGQGGRPGGAPAAQRPPR